MQDNSEIFKEWGVEILNQYFEYENESSNLECTDQIGNIVNFQNRLMGYKENIIPRFRSTIGKELESFKVNLKRVNRGINSIDKNSDVDKYIISYQNNLISQGQKAIDYISVNSYFDIIMRSMKRYEICIGRSDKGNLRLNNNKLEIGTTKYISYSLIENDLFSYLKKLRKKKIEVDIRVIIEQFLYESNLGDDSRKYIYGLMFFPVEELKVILRYINGKLDLEGNKIINLIDQEREFNKNIIECLR